MESKEFELPIEGSLSKLTFLHKKENKDTIKVSAVTDKKQSNERSKNLKNKSNKKHKS